MQLKINNVECYVHELRLSYIHFASIAEFEQMQDTLISQTIRFLFNVYGISINRFNMEEFFKKFNPMLMYCAPAGLSFPTEVSRQQFLNSIRDYLTK